MGQFFIGTSGYQYKNWKGDFYPEKLSMAKMFDYYKERFNSVEINGTFYSSLKETTVKKWLDAAPEDFAFVFKGSRYISHYIKLKVNQESFEKFFGPFEAHIKNGNHKHLVLWQMPQNLGKNMERLEAFVKSLPYLFRYAFEFRHPSWFDEEVYNLLRKYDAAIVVADSPEVDGDRKWPMVFEETASFYYVRFHGSKALYTTRYSDEELNKYAKIMKEKLDKGLDVYAYFNNDAHGHAPHDAIRLREMIEAK